VTIGVLALQGGFALHADILRDLGADVREVRTPRDLEGLDGLVIPGGESTTISKLVDEFDLREPIESRIRAGMPVYGSCAGMIMLATEVLDGRPDQRPFGAIEMTVRRNAFGRQVDSFEAPVTLSGVEGGPVPAVFIRAPWVERVGDGVEVAGRVASGRAAGRIVAVRQGNLLATAFHPELTGDLRVHRLFVDIAQQARG